MRLLCVEDEAPLREDIAEYLRLQHYEVDEAGCGEEALEQMRMHRYDAVVCDIKMPRMNGFEVLQHMRMGSETEQMTPFIFLTALTDQEDWMRGHQWGCDAYLTKPIHFGALDAAVKARILRQRMSEHLFSSQSTTLRSHIHTALADSLLPPMTELTHLSDYLVRAHDALSPERVHAYIQHFQTAVAQHICSMELLLSTLAPRHDWKTHPHTPLTPEEILMHALTLAVDIPAEIRILTQESPLPLLELNGLEMSRALAGILRACTPMEDTLPVLEWRSTDAGYRFTVSDHPDALIESSAPFYPLDAMSDLSQISPITRERILPLLYASSIAQAHGGTLEIKLWEGHWLAAAISIPTTPNLAMPFKAI